MPVGSAKFGLIAAAGAGGAGFTAFGGIITQYENSGTTYRVHTFRGSGKFVVSSGETDVEYAILAGGGAGGMGSGSYAGGGGGAGGFGTNKGGTLVTVDVASSPYTITVGAGGVGIVKTSGGYIPTYNTSGGNSSALGVTRTGGGRGGGDQGNVTPATGGSGGGGDGSSSSARRTGAAGNAGSYSPVEGYAGGSNPNGGNISYPSGSAGGGAGGVGYGGGADGGYMSSGAWDMLGWVGLINAGGGGGGGGGYNKSGHTAGGNIYYGAGFPTNYNTTNYGYLSAAAGHRAEGGSPNSGSGGGGTVDYGTGNGGGDGGAGIVIIRYVVS